MVSGKTDLRPSNNAYDWLGAGVYFWEQSPKRAIEYAIDCAKKEQHYAGNIKTPFIVGAIIELRNCLNLIDKESAVVLKEAYEGLEKIYKEAGKPMPKNNDANRRLDCAVIKHLHHSRQGKPLLQYDTIRCAFVEGDPVYPGANFHTRLHIEICVINPECIKGYFLPKPLDAYNPYIKKKFNLSKVI